MFINGKPNTPIPEGFTLKETAAEKSQEKTQEEIEAEELQAMELANRGPAEEGNDEPSESWGETNFNALSEDPIGFGKDALAGIGTGLTGMLGGFGIAGKAAEGIANQSAIAAAETASMVGKDMGLDTTDLDADIEGARGKVGLSNTIAEGLGMGTGKNNYNSYQDALAAKAEAKQVAKEVSKTPTTPAKSDVTPTPSTTPSNTPDDDDSAGSTGGSRSGGLGGGEMNKGGLVKKRTTKKTTTTKKTQPKKKGLASK